MIEFTEPVTEAEKLYLYIDNACEVTKDALRAAVKEKGPNHIWPKRLAVALMSLDRTRGEAFLETKV